MNQWWKCDEVALMDLNRGESTYIPKVVLRYSCTLTVLKLCITGLG